MSQGRPVPLPYARQLAGELVQMLEPSCERVAIAGSVRREKRMVADIELVAMPLLETVEGGDLWGTPAEVDRLAEALTAGRDTGILPARLVESTHADGSLTTGTRLGRSYQALEFRGMPVDLFIVHDVAQWGVILTIRTGPADWSHRLVTDCQRFLRRVDGGYLYRSGQRVPCPTEEGFLAALGQPWVEPQHRRADLVQIHA